MLLQKLNIIRNKIVIISAIGLLLIAVLVPAFRMTVFGAPAGVVNPDLEMVTGTKPNCFSQSGWGSHSVAWSLTTDAHSGTKAQSVKISNYISGDRKLIITENTTCAPAVASGNTYDLSVWYKSSSARNSLTIFKHSAAGWTYWTDLKTLPAVGDWTLATATTPTIPIGTDQLSFGISISGNGMLVTDDYSLAQTGGISDPTPSGSELTNNPGLEEGGTLPTNWILAGWGDAVINGAVTSNAHSGTRAYSITLSGRTQGDYKLLPADTASPSVEPSAIYNLSTWYKSTSSSNSLTIFAHTASGWGYWTDIRSLPAAGDWTKITAETPPIPSGVDAIAWGISISGNGQLVTDDYSTTRKGEYLPPKPTTDATQGKWTVLDYNIPIRAVHSTLMKNGKVLMIAGSGNRVESFNAGTFKASIWDPVSGVFNTLSVPKDMFCAGHTTLPDGRILIQGGTKLFPSTITGADYAGLKDSWIFDPDANTFTPTNDANEGHWYPTLTVLGNGNVWMAGGLKEDTTGAVNTERFDYLTSKWLPTGQIPQTWSFWGLYPHMFLMQDGRLFYSGGHVFGNGLPGSGASIYDPESSAITSVSGLRMKDMRDQSASLLLPPAQNQKVLITGGGNINTANPATNLTDIIDLKQTTPAYQPGPDLPGLGKMYVNGTILPDRTVLISNGGRLNRDDSTNVLTAAIYNPVSNSWYAVAADPIGRNYHSSSVLLPDGRVVSLGSNPANNTFEMRISIYQPSYLFRTPRPEISNTPIQTSYGQSFSFNVSISSGKTIKWAQLTRPMSITHQMDSNLRLVDLPIVVQNGVATVSVPGSRNLLPPGPYMLTVTDSDGIPSIASWVMVK